MSIELAPPLRRRTLLPASMLRLVSDERLIEEIRAGSERAFEVLFDRHNRPVLAFCRHMLGSREEAEDAVQQTFMSAYRDLPRSSRPIAARPWLLAIARNRCISILRSRRELPVDQRPLATGDVTTEVVRREDLQVLLADLLRLPDDQRAALLLTELGGVPQDEIGSMLGCPRERVKALVFQARTTLASDRAARETSCVEIRSQLATLRGGALRRGILRRHVRECPGCMEFQRELRSRRRNLPALLPITPGVGLMRGALGALFGGTGASGGGIAAVVGTVGGNVAAKAAIAVAIATAGAAAGATVGGEGHAVPVSAPTAPEAAIRPAAERTSAHAVADREQPAVRSDGAEVSAPVGASPPRPGVMPHVLSPPRREPAVVLPADAERVLEPHPVRADPAVDATPPGGAAQAAPPAAAAEPDAPAAPVQGADEEVAVAQPKPSTGKRPEEPRPVQPVVEPGGGGHGPGPNGGSSRPRPAAPVAGLPPAPRPGGPGATPQSRPDGGTPGLQNRPEAPPSAVPDQAHAHPRGVTAVAAPADAVSAAG